MFVGLTVDGWSEINGIEYTVMRIALANERQLVFNWVTHARVLQKFCEPSGRTQEASWPKWLRICSYNSRWRPSSLSCRWVYYEMFVTHTEKSNDLSNVFLLLGILSSSLRTWWNPKSHQSACTSLSLTHVYPWKLCCSFFFFPIIIADSLINCFCFSNILLISLLFLSMRY